jgi:hypothetical protein
MQNFTQNFSCDTSTLLYLNNLVENVIKIAKKISKKKNKKVLTREKKK